MFFFKQGLYEEINYISHTPAKTEHLLKAMPVFIISQVHFFPYEGRSEVAMPSWETRWPDRRVYPAHDFSNLD